MIDYIAHHPLLCVHPLIRYQGIAQLFHPFDKFQIIVVQFISSCNIIMTLIKEFVSNLFVCSADLANFG